MTTLLSNLLHASTLALALVAPCTSHAGSEIDARHGTMTTIVFWLSTNFDLPATYEHPKVDFVSPARMTELRYRGLIAHNPAPAVGQSDQASDLVAIYNDKSRTIYLSEGWTGDTPAQVSVLVHEMVHHLQNLAGTKFECPQARELPAYAAQEQWLSQFGLTLEGEFGINGITRFVRTRCLG